MKDDDEASASTSKLGKYMAPRWSCEPDAADRSLRLDVVRNGIVLPNPVQLSKRAFYVVGRQPDICHIEALHPTISRQHVVFQHGPQGRMFIYDMGSTHGTFVNKQRIPAGKFMPIHVGDIVKLGQSSRLYAVEGPDRLRPPEWQTFQAPLAPRPPVEKPTHDDQEEEEEDAEEQDEDDDDDDFEIEEYMDIGSNKYSALSSKQKSTIERLWKRRRKTRHIETEAQTLSTKMSVNGTLSSGQQTQLQRCHERIAQLNQEIDNTIEEFRESIRSSKRSKRSSAQNRKDAAERAKQKRSRSKRARDIDSDDDDEFYDRTRVVKAKTKKTAKVENIETLQKQLLEIEQQESQLQTRIDDLARRRGGGEGDDADDDENYDEDALDAYMLEMKDSIKASDRSKLEKQMEEIQVQKSKIERLIVFLRPAGSELLSTVDNESLPRPAAKPHPAELIVRRSDQLPDQKEDEQERKKELEEQPRGAESLIGWLEQQRKEQEKQTYELKGSTHVSEGGLITRKKSIESIPQPQSKPPTVKTQEEIRVEEFMAQWKPPTGQTGDGITNLNEKFGY